MTLEQLIEQWDLVPTTEGAKDARKMSAEKDPIMSRYFECLIAAGKMEAQYEAQMKKPLNPMVKEMAAAMFIEKNERERPRGGKGFQRPELPKAPEDIKCPKCQGPMLDQSATKKSDKAPDYICSNFNCKNEAGYRTGVWKKAA